MIAMFLVPELHEHLVFHQKISGPPQRNQTASGQWRGATLSVGQLNWHQSALESRDLFKAIQAAKESI